MPLKDKEALKEYIRVYRKRWRKENPEKSLAEKRKFNKRHEARLKAKWRKGRSRLEDWYVLKLLVAQTGKSREELSKNKTLINKIRKRIIEKRIRRILRQLQNEKQD